MQDNLVYAGAHAVDRLEVHLRGILREGGQPARLVGQVDLLDELGLVQEEHDRYESAVLLGRVLADAVHTLGDGPEGSAAACLFGLTAESRGRLLKDRRRLAAAEFDVLPSTFRKHYEHRLLGDVAFELWAAHQRSRRQRATGGGEYAQPPGS